MGLISFALAGVLLASAAGKARAGRAGRDALRSYGLGGPRVRAAVWASTIAVEAGLAVAVAARVPWAAAAAAGLLAVFALILAAAILQGRSGRLCGCLGSRSRIGWPAAGRAALLAAAFTALAFVPDYRPSPLAWLAAGLVVALAGLAALGIAVLALARELGELRLAVAPQAALSLDHEGPELGGRVALIERFERRAPLALAVFTSPGCSLCSALAPSLRLLENDPEVELQLFDEEADAEAWVALAVPGSPYGVVLAHDGEVLAKGTFNSLFQLESLLAHATRPVHA